jgi:hypothetical protein
MGSFDKNNQKPGFLFLSYQSILQLMGYKRFFPEIQSIDKPIRNSISESNNNPSNKLMFRALVKLLITVIKIMYNNYFWVEQWFLLLNIDNGLSQSFDEFKRIVPPLDRFWADPHIILIDNIYYVFVEEFFYHKRKGCISVIEVDESGNHQKSVPVLEKTYHLSYPFTFKNEDKYYMVPESSENKTIDLYECVEFPYEWRFVMHLMNNIIAVDTTLFYYSNLWWLFTAMPEKSEALPKVKLYLFYSDRLLTEHWKPHPHNPVISEFDSARPAGKIYVNNGKIYRPSQDASKSYGSSILINEITHLSENEYMEKNTTSIRPDWDKKIKGTHTFSHEGQLTVLDVYRKLPRFYLELTNQRF